MFLLVKCGGMAADIEPIIPQFVTNIVRILQFGIPIILILFGMLDLGKAVMGNDEKQMKEAQGKLIKRVVYAVLVFFIIAIVKFVFGLLASSDEKGKSDFTGCINCFLDYTTENCKN